MTDGPDERLLEALRELDAPVDPPLGFADRLYSELTGESSPRGTSATGSAESDASLITVKPQPQRRRERRGLAAAAAGFAVVALLAALTWAIRPGPTGGVATPVDDLQGTQMSTADPDVVSSDDTADVTASDQGCVTSVSHSLRARPTSLTVRNDSSSDVEFQLLRVAVAYDEIVAYFADEAERIAAHEAPSIADRAAFTDRLGSVELQPGEDGSVSGELRAGTYTVLCTVLDDNGDDVTPLPSGPLTVTGRDATWTMDVPSRNVFRVWQSFDFVCPPDGEPYDVWGTDIYMIDSSMCTAAVHAGVITLDEGGPITIQIRSPEDSFQGSERNGISSSDYGFASSFRVVEAAVSETAPTSPTTATAVPTTSEGSVDMTAPRIGWRTTAERHRGENGEQFAYLCAQNGAAAFMWGTDTYTDDSSICTAAVHAGVITLDEGGPVTIEIRPGEDSYQGSERNGIWSSGYALWAGSFVVIDD